MAGVKGGVSQVARVVRVHLCLNKRWWRMTVACLRYRAPEQASVFKLCLQVIFRWSLVASPRLDTQRFCGQRWCSSTVKDMKKTTTIHKCKKPQVHYNRECWGDEFRLVWKEAVFKRANEYGIGQISLIHRWQKKRKKKSSDTNFIPDDLGSS